VSDIKSEITQAVAAHGQWKSKLRLAIDTGQSEPTPERVKQDCNCGFGKWLYNGIDDANKASDDYQLIKRLHADFHKEAGAILEMGLNGDKGNANAKMSIDSPFSKISADLTKAMMAWKEKL